MAIPRDEDPRQEKFMENTLKMKGNENNSCRLVTDEGEAGWREQTGHQSTKQDVQ